MCSFHGFSYYYLFLVDLINYHRRLDVDLATQYYSSLDLKHAHISRVGSGGSGHTGQMLEIDRRAAQVDLHCTYVLHDCTVTVITNTTPLAVCSTHTRTHTHTTHTSSRSVGERSKHLMTSRPTGLKLVVELKTTIIILPNRPWGRFLSLNGRTLL